MVTDKNISVCEYLKGKYGEDITEVYQSPCTFKQIAGSDEYFLPQFIKMTAKSSDAPMNYGKALELTSTSKSPFERFREVQNVCSSITNALKVDEKFRGRVVIADRQVMMDMIHLSNPTFTVKNKHGNNLKGFPPTDLPGAWGRNAGGPILNENVTRGPAVPLTQ